MDIKDFINTTIQNTPLPVVILIFVIAPIVIIYFLFSEYLRGKRSMYEELSYFILLTLFSFIYYYYHLGKCGVLIQLIWWLEVVMLLLLTSLNKWIKKNEKTRGKAYLKENPDYKLKLENDLENTLIHWQNGILRSAREESTEFLKDNINAKLAIEHGEVDHLDELILIKANQVIIKDIVLSFLNQDVESVRDEIDFLHYIIKEYLFDIVQ